MLFLTSFAFLMNDLWDLGKDVIAGRTRPLATGQITRFQVIVSVTAMLALAYLVAWATNAPHVLAAAVVISVAAGLYSPITAKQPLLKNLYAAVLSCSPIVLAGAAVPIERSGITAAFVALFIAGREVLLDVKDLEGDRVAGLRTLAVRLGESNASVLAWAIMTVGLVVYALGARSPLARLALGGVVGAFLWAFAARTAYDIASSRLRLVMLVGIVGMVVC